MKPIKQILFILIIISFNLHSFAQNNIRSEIKPPYNIKDYFLLLPDSLIGNINLNQRELSLKYKTLEDLWNHDALWIIDTMDYRNGYMKLSSTGDGAGTYFEITYFIKKDKIREIAVNTTHWDIAMTSSDVKFYSFKNNTWQDITKDVLPLITISDIIGKEKTHIINDNIESISLVYILPQHGKTILVKLDLGTLDFMLSDNLINEEEYIKIKNSAKTIKLIWNDGIFVIKN